MRESETLGLKSIEEALELSARMVRKARELLLKTESEGREDLILTGLKTGLFSCVHQATRLEGDCRGRDAKTRCNAVAAVYLAAATSVVRIFVRREETCAAKAS